ncbi:MAG: hypothetical protein IJ530_09210 [Treponema sp.]|uniref:hypothetical protein n=1 Tax=Treponema sp. TaxID=166 RepID=UPI0025F84153|nr:hypothetical protein [Treponema sp.]MBQ8679933.1 hypothetical protein [Treponema sp.]
MKKNTILFLSLLCIIELSVIFFGYMYTKSVKKTLGDAVSELAEKVESLESNMREEFKETGKNINSVLNSTNAQFSETTKMSRTYGQILEEQQKQRVDTVSRDTSLIEKKKNADALYNAKEYKRSYELYSEILTYQGEDSDVRFKKMYSLFNMNKMDSAKYKEILTDCAILKNKGYANPAIDEIERFISFETKGGLQ